MLHIHNLTERDTQATPGHNTLGSHSPSQILAILCFPFTYDFGLNVLLYKYQGTVKSIVLTAMQTDQIYYTYRQTQVRWMEQGEHEGAGNSTMREHMV